MNKFKVGQKWAISYEKPRYGGGYCIANMEVSGVTDKYVEGYLLIDNNEFYRIPLENVTKSHLIADSDELICLLATISEEWYWLGETKLLSLFRESFPESDYELIRFDQTFYPCMVYRKKKKINRLWGNMAYLIGPIDRCPDNGRAWRKQIEPDLLKRGIIPLNPLEKPIDLGIEDDASRELRRVSKLNGDYDVITNDVKLIRHVDLRFVDHCNFIICYIDTDIHMTGTYEELFWANRLKRPILIVCKQGKKNIPDWLFGVCEHELFFDSFEELLKYVDYIDSSENPADLGRWLFLDYKKLFGQIFSS